MEQLIRRMIETPEFIQKRWAVDIENQIVAVYSNPVIVAVNPRIVYSSEERQYIKEIDPQDPFIIANIKRPTQIRARFKLPNGVMTSQTYTGLTARYFQIAIDQINGISTLERATAYHKQKALNKKKKMNGRQNTSNF